MPTGYSPELQSRWEMQCAGQWSGLALGTLTLAGLFSLVVGRMPTFDRLVTDPLFFKRGLGVMGVGGLIAVVGGLLFLGIVAAVWRQGSERRIRTLKPVTEA